MRNAFPEVLLPAQTGKYSGGMVEHMLSPVALVIIDDNPLSVEFVAAALEREGVEIYSACHPREGLDLVYKHHPKIVITDLALPDMNGLEVLDRVLKFDPKTKVVIITAYPSKNTAEVARKKHAVEYLIKPVPLSELRHCVGDLIEAALREQNPDN
jgi:DNA-binding NtrC family response regulator